MRRHCSIQSADTERLRSLDLSVGQGDIGRDNAREAGDVVNHLGSCFLWGSSGETRRNDVSDRQPRVSFEQSLPDKGGGVQMPAGGIGWRVRWQSSGGGAV